jgi:hypothetical protein
LIKGLIPSFEADADMARGQAVKFIAVLGNFPGVAAAEVDEKYFKYEV